MKSLSILPMLLIISKINSLSKKVHKQCAAQNRFFPKLGEARVADPTVCTSVDSQCCFINLTHRYGDHQINSYFCGALTKKQEEFLTHFTNLYNDDLLNYANFTGNNYDLFKKYGRNLNQSTRDMFNCYYGPSSFQEYSTYRDRNCAKFKDGECLYVKNRTSFREFVRDYQVNYSALYCPKKDVDGKCISYRGTRANDKMVRPLFMDLINYLQADEDAYNIVNTFTNIDIYTEEDEDDSNTDTVIKAWYDSNGKVIKNCTERPAINFSIICPESFKGSRFLKGVFSALCVVAMILVF